METTKKKRTREEVRAAFREYLDDKKKRMEEKQRELEEIHEMRMSGMTMEEIFASSHGVRHLGMGASSPKMRIEKRKSALASVSFRLGF